MPVAIPTPLKSIIGLPPAGGIHVPATVVLVVVGIQVVSVVVQVALAVLVVAVFGGRKDEKELHNEAFKL